MGNASGITNSMLPNYSFYNLLLLYGYEELTGQFWQVLDGMNQNPMKMPIAATLAGYFNISEGLYRIGSSVGYWNATLDPNINYAIRTTINEGTIGITHGGQRIDNVHSVRCLAR